MRHYELVVVLSPMLNQDQAAEAWGRIKGFVTTRNAEVTHEERWGTRRLAYPIRKGSYRFLEGTYYLTRFSTEKPFNKEMETFLRLDEQVLRYLVVATGEPTRTPPPVQAEPVAEATATQPEAEAAVSPEADVEAPVSPETEEPVAMTSDGSEESRAEESQG